MNVLGNDDLRAYWQQPPQAQETILQRLTEAHKREDGLVLYQGKYYKPGDVPCECELVEAEHCYEDMHGSPGYCECVCHHTDEGSW